MQKIRQTINKIRQIVYYFSGFTLMDRYFRYRHTGFAEGERYKRGHFYSPLPDIEEVQKDSKKLFRMEVDLFDSIDLKDNAQHSLLTKFVSFYDDFCWPEQPMSEYRFHFSQGYFLHGDALMLYSILRHFKPKRIIEVGSGFTSALMLDTNDLFLEKSVQFKFVEPYPERLLSILREGDKENCEIIQDKVQNLPIDFFKKLSANDILFIDSSHVSKIGSDVNFLIFEVLPNLQPGVIIHFHDILWPFEYRKEWVINKRAWNEAYLLRAFLQYNSRFKIVLFNSYLGYSFKNFFDDKMKIFMKDTGGSLWIKKNL